MNARYSIRREPEGMALPFGAGGVAAIGALALGVVGLAVPIAWLETISFQLYLDTIIPAAAPPLGTTARIIAAVVLALFGALLGYVLAKAFGVVASDFSLADLIARLRGTGAEDEADAPELRAADRHPDAPARRPFSATRDIPVRDGEIGESADMSIDDEDELVLDAQFEPLHRGGDADFVAPVLAAVEPVGRDERAPFSWNRRTESIEDYDLQPPDPAEWETAAPVEIETAQTEPEADGPGSPDVSQETVAEPRAAVASVPIATPPPLDLSVARLDELIARLEAGLSRKGQPAPAGAVEIVSGADATGEPAAPPADDPAFPQDPALAAALATLRKMNQRS